MTRTVRTSPVSAPTTRPATVSVVVPHHNYGRYLPSAIDSVVGQPHVIVDVIIVDDASRPEDLAVARRVAAGHDRVRLIEQKVNCGPVVTFNRGLKEANGRYLVRLDADDMLSPGSLARAVDLLEAYPSTGFVYGHPLHFSGSPPQARQRVRSWTLWPGEVWLERRSRLGYNCITSPEVVMRKSVVDVTGGQRPLPHAHDMEMWLRLAMVSDVGHVDGPDQALHREHTQSLSARHVDEMTDLRERALAFEVLFEWAEGHFGHGHRLEPVARRTLAHEAVTRARHEFDRGRGESPFVEELVAYATSLYPEVQNHRVWRSLQAVRRRHRPLSGWAPPQVFRGLARRARADWMRHRWHRTGV